MSKLKSRQKYIDLRPYLTPSFTAEDVNSIYNQIETIISKHDDCGVGRTSGTFDTAQEDCENTLSTHKERGLSYTTIQHMYSLSNSEAMVRLEAYILARLDEDGYELENIAFDGRGGVSEDAEAYHLYVATTSEKKKT